MRGLTGVAAAISIAFALGQPAVAADKAFAPVTTNESSVAVKVTPKKLEGPVWEFEVSFDTHSQDLKDDLAKTAFLVASDGSETPPLEWSGPPPGGHHRAGLLKFHAPNPVPPRAVVKITRPGEPKARTFEWSLR